MGDTSVELWLERHRFNALEQVLEAQGTSLEKHLQNYLIDLYSEQVPSERRQEVESLITEERLQDEQRAREARKFSVYHITESDTGHYFESDYSLDLMQLASLVRRYQRCELKHQPENFVALFQNSISISAAQFEEYARMRTDNTGQIIGVFDINFDRQELAGVHITNGWKAYSMKEASTAAYHAYRAEFLPLDQRWSRFLVYLNGREPTQPFPACLKQEGLTKEDYCLRIQEETGPLTGHILNNCDAPMLPPVCPCVAFCRQGWQRYTIRTMKPRIEPCVQKVRQ